MLKRQKHRPRLETCKRKVVCFGHLFFGHLNLFMISKFGFRIYIVLTCIPAETSLTTFPWPDGHDGKEVSESDP